MPGARTIAEIVSSAAERDFVGRTDELGVIRDASRPARGRPLVVSVAGPGGIGKSRLVRTALGRLEEGIRTVLLDCREIEPTPQGFTDALAAALGLRAPCAGIADVVEGVRADGRPMVLALDTYERFGLLDTWLRQTFLPALPETVLTILSGRDGPGAAWLAAPGWAGLVRQLRLGPLRHSEAMTLLRARGLTEVQAARANGFARGHPLALELAAAALLADPKLDIEAGPPPAVIRQLLDAVLAELPERTIETLEAASTSRRVTEPILRSLLARSSVRDAFDALRALPFVERTPEGLMIHDVVRETVAADLRERDPERRALYRRRAWSYFEAQARTPSPERLWAVTADLIYLIQNPVLRTSCFPEGSAEHAVERAVADDGPAIRDIVAAHEPPGAARLLEAWWERRPEDFSVARGPYGEVGAVLVLAELGELDAAADADPVVRAWRAHMDAVPPRPGDRVLTMRRWLGRDSGEMLSPAVGACWLDVKRVYMELRPRLSRLYSAMADPDALAPIFQPLGFAPAGAPLDVGGTFQQPVWLDFGEGSVDGWLRRLVGGEITGEEEAIADLAGVAAGAGLSPRETEVLALVGEGLSNKGIAARLVISEKTAGRHLENIFCKLGVHTRAQAVQVAGRMGHSPDGGNGGRA